MIKFDTTTILCIILIILQVGFIIYFIRRNRRIAASAAKAPVMTPENTYTELRRLAFSVTPAQLKIAIPNKDTLVYGMIMDWDMGDVIVTLAAYITGACSMYLNTGGGFVKGGQNPAVAEIAVEFVTMAKDYLDMAIPAETNGLPGKQNVRFYFLTNHRMFAVEEQIARFDDNTSPLLPFFEKANEVISGMRNGGNGELAN